jgi:hypothetical protein
VCCVPSAFTARSNVSASVLEEDMSSLTPIASAADRRGRNCSLQGQRARGGEKGGSKREGKEEVQRRKERRRRMVSERHWSR